MVKPASYVDHHTDRTADSRSRASKQSDTCPELAGTAFSAPPNMSERHVSKKALCYLQEGVSKEA